MTLHPGEQELLRSNGNRILLTNHRIQLNDSSWGHAYSITLFLEDISSIQLMYKSKIALLFLAIFFFLAGAITMFFIDGELTPKGLPLIVGVICLALWWVSRSHIISIHPHGGKPLAFSVSDVSELQIENFLDKVQLAKAQRVNQLHHL